MPDIPAGFQRQRLSTPDCEFELVTAGQGPALLCLHGFPDTAETWFELAPALVEAGYRVIIPHMPGYAPSGVMRTDCRLPSLARALLQLLDQLQLPKAYVLGHDWGAACAYTMAAIAPQRVQAIVCAAVPHLRRFLRLNAAQLKRSWYMGFFQMPFLPERRLRQADGAFLHQLWSTWSPTWAYTAADFSVMQACLQQAQSAQAALAYYRALPASLLAAERSKILGKIEVPSLAISGALDGCIGSDMFADQEQYFAQAYQLVTVPQAGHFMHREQAGLFLESVLGFLRAH